jgi:DNA polymerase elongation subunit (family B)
MVKAKETAESMGFSVTYGDVDSIFVYKSGSGENEYKELARVISERAEIPAALDKIFRSIAFMRTRSVKGLTAIKRYFGITEDGEIEARGIELRRSDTPELIKAFQKELIKSIYACSSYEEAQKRALNLAPVILSKYIEIIREKSVKVDSLVINKRLGKDPYSYKANVAQKILGLTLGAKAEEKISFVLGRNGPELDLENYDWKKYYKMIFRAAETVLAPLDIRPSLELRLDAL